MGKALKENHLHFVEKIKKKIFLSALPLGFYFEWKILELLFTFKQQTFYIPEVAFEILDFQV